VEALEAITSRRSIRRFEDKPVPEELVSRVMDAARHAPSANNSQPWEFVIVTEKSLKEKISKANIYGGFLEDAPAVIVTLSDSDKSPSHCVEDCSAAIENLMVAAYASGLGTCWVAIYNPSTKEREDLVRDILDIPKRFRVIAAVAIGYPGEKPYPKKLRPLNEVMHREKYGNR